MTKKEAQFLKSLEEVLKATLLKGSTRTDARTQLLGVQTAMYAFMPGQGLPLHEKAKALFDSFWDRFYTDMSKDEVDLWLKELFPQEKDLESAKRVWWRQE